jgi:uncharacterized protein YjbI with pentapeptide repeats
MHRVFLAECDCEEASFVGAVLQRARASWCRFALATFSDANWADGVAQNCTFYGADCDRARFARASFSHAGFQRASLRGADFQGANIAGADFENADLTGANFREAVMTAARFAGANLTGVRGLSADQLAQTLTSMDTILPNGAHGPYRRFSGAERPVHASGER